MEMRILGRTGQAISAIGLGCMGMSEFYGPRNDAQSLATLETAFDHGVTFFDTADIYGRGHNEELLGRFLFSAHRSEITVATKFGIIRTPGAARTIENSPAYIHAACDASLRRLGVDVIDLYYVHRRNQNVPIEDTVGVMAQLVAAGKVRFLGLSEVSSDTLRRAHAVHPISALQTEYSLWSREPENGLLQTCRELDITFVAYSPLGRAFLTGTIDSLDQLAPDDFRLTNPRFGQEAFIKNTKPVQKLVQVASRYHATPGQVALAWLLKRHSHVIPIPGTKRPLYAIENADAGRVDLDAFDMAALETAFVPEAITGRRYTTDGSIGIESA